MTLESSSSLYVSTESIHDGRDLTAPWMAGREARDSEASDTFDKNETFVRSESERCRSESLLELWVAELDDALPKALDSGNCLDVGSETR